MSLRKIRSTYYETDDAKMNFIYVAIKAEKSRKIKNYLKRQVNERFISCLFQKDDFKSLKFERAK